MEYDKPTEIARPIVVDIFETQGDKFKLWSNAKVTGEQVAKLLADTVAYKKSRTVETLKDLDKTSANINTRLSDYLLYRYEQEQGS